LEHIFKEESYKQYLELKEQKEKQRGVENDERWLQLQEVLSFDTATIRRRRNFDERLKQKQKEIRAGHVKAAASYKSVVQESSIGGKNIFSFLGKIVLQGRKLKPRVVQRPALAVESIHSTKLLVHIIKGYNIPERDEVF